MQRTTKNIAKTYVSTPSLLNFMTRKAGQEEEEEVVDGKEV